MNIKRYILLSLALVLLVFGCKYSTVSHHEDRTYPVTTEVEHPDWTENAVIYEVNIRQYTPEGTIKALTPYLPILRKMGVDILWLMPVYPIGEKNRKGTLGSYYSVKNYLKVNPEYGTIDDLEDLVKEAHGLDMYVILDWVANHTAWDNPLFKEHPDWYKKDSLGHFVSPFDWTDVVQLNYDNKDMREYMIDAMKFWVNETDIDGFRCDVAGLVPCDFWEEAREQLDAIKPVFMLAEDEKDTCLVEKAFDMNYSWELYHLMNDIAKGTKKVSDLKAYFTRQDSIFDPAIYKMNFITNHDENSWNGTVFERLGDGVKAFALLTFTVPGMPLIYSGQEVGNKKRLRFFDKDTITWPVHSKWTSFYHHLIKLKKDHSVFWNGTSGGSFNIIDLKKDPDVFAFQRTNDDDNFYVVINFGGEPATINLKDLGLKGDFHDYFTAQPADTDKPVVLNTYDYMVLMEDY